MLEEQQTSRFYTSPILTDAVVYQSDTQIHRYATKNQYSQFGKIEKADGEVRLRKEILAKRHVQSMAETSPTAHDDRQPPHCNERKLYQLKSGSRDVITIGNGQPDATFGRMSKALTLQKIGMLMHIRRQRESRESGNLELLAVGAEEKDI